MAIKKYDKDISISEATLKLLAKINRFQSDWYVKAGNPEPHRLILTPHDLYKLSDNPAFEQEMKELREYITRYLEKMGTVNDQTNLEDLGIKLW